MDEFTAIYNNIAKFLYEYKLKNGGSKEDTDENLQQKFNELLKNPNELKFQVLGLNYIKDITLNGDTITILIHYLNMCITIIREMIYH